MATTEHNYCHRLKLNSIKDLDEIRNLAQIETNGDNYWWKLLEVEKQWHISMQQLNSYKSSK